MEVRSLSYSTLLHVLSYRSIIENKQEYLVIKTPHNPGHFWGNFLLFNRPPNENALVEWEHLFDQEFMDMPVTHKAFAWDSSVILLTKSIHLLQTSITLKWMM